MAIYSSDRFVLPLPEWHRFPMAKYSRLRESVERSRIEQERAVEEAKHATAVAKRAFAQLEEAVGTAAAAVKRLRAVLG